MSLIRSVNRIPLFMRQCARLATISQPQNRNYADMAFTFASPGAMYYDNANIKQVDVPSFSGDFGILPDHVPLLAVLKPGVITVMEEDGSNKKFFVSSGSITINDDSSVQILAEESARVEELDHQAIREGAAKASQDMSAATTDETRAEAQIAADCYDALQKAIS